MQFLRDVAAALKAAGFDATYHVGLDQLHVNGCKFSAEVRRETFDGDPKLVKFLGSSFGLGKRGQFDIGRAVGLVVSAMPAKLAEIGARERAMAHKLVRSKLTGAPPMQDDRLRVWYPAVGAPGVHLADSEYGVDVMVRVQSEADARAAVEALRRRVSDGRSDA